MYISFMVKLLKLKNINLMLKLTIKKNKEKIMKLKAESETVRRPAALSSTRRTVVSTTGTTTIKN